MKKYEYIQIGIASKEEILSWSHGEVINHETINYRTLKPEVGGLFCERIFGPKKSYQCRCTKTNRNLEKGQVCEKCGVEITDSKVRRERMGHIALASPVVHTWFFKKNSSKIATLLGMKAKIIDSLIYYISYIVTDPGDIAELEQDQVITEQRHKEFQLEYGRSAFKAKTGAEAIRYLLKKFDLAKTSEELRDQLGTATKQKKKAIVKQLEVVESFLHSDNNPADMVMDVIPVIPPDLRPMVQLDGGRFAKTDLSDLYINIINRNIRLKKEIEIRGPELIVKNEKRMLQQAVDALIDSSKDKSKGVDRNHPTKSLTDMLKGKQGRFRQNLLGKRVDFSGRSVIAVGPDLKMYQCGLPREMALILFKPFIVHAIIEKYSNEQDGNSGKISVKKAKEMVESGHPEAMEQLEKIITEHPVLLNRAPTLHRLGIQAFEPKLIEGKAIRLHPLACPPFNADFDGDQMAVHVPLSTEACAEARLLMLASKNILAPKDGKPIVTPSQDMVLGNYYLTIEDENDDRNGMIIGSISEARLAYENDIINLQTRFAMPIQALLDEGYKIVNDKVKEDKERKYKLADYKYIITTYGKIIFNTLFPRNCYFVTEASIENLRNGVSKRFLLKKGTDIREELKTGKDRKWISDGTQFKIDHHPASTLDINVKVKHEVLPHPFTKKFLKLVIAEVFKNNDLTSTSQTLDRMKDLGFKYSTISGMTVSAFDINVIDTKNEKIAAADKKVAQYEKVYRRGMTTEKEKNASVIAEWQKTKDALKDDINNDVLQNYMSNHLYIMSDSGARGNIDNFVQLSGMRGLMAKPSGEQMTIPIRSSFREGLSMSEFFVSSHGSRKGSTDTALKTAESGYLTRRLVDVSQDVTIKKTDCHTTKGIEVTEMIIDGKVVESIKERIMGRYTNKPVYNPKNKKMIIDANEYISEEIADEIQNSGVKSVFIRSALTCDCVDGICQKCYGADLTTGSEVEKGEVVGIIAAQSIGEPGTQLTMRTFHTGGVAGGDDITQGLPRVQELFERRHPKLEAQIAAIDGEIISVKILEGKDRHEIIIKNPITGEEVPYKTNSGRKVLVSEGEMVKAGQPLTNGLIFPIDLLRVSNTNAVSNYIVQEIQKVYRSQGVDINDKHVEIIVKQMLQQVQIISEGDTDLLPGSYVSRTEMLKIIKKCNKEGKKVPVIKSVLFGITKSSLKSDSFLSAASFQETTKTLTATAISGKRDYLEGLKENIIIGGLIPAGTGLVKESDDLIELPETDDDIDDDIA